MGSSGWRGLWTAVMRRGRSTYTPPAPPRLNLSKAALTGGEVADGSSGLHIADGSYLNLVSREGAPARADDLNKGRLVELVLAARCGYQGLTLVQRRAISVMQGRGDLMHRAQTEPWVSRLVKVVVTARCGYQGPTWVQRHKVSIMLGLRDLMQPAQTEPWGSRLHQVEVLANPEDGRGGALYNRSSMACPFALAPTTELAAQMNMSEKDYLRKKNKFLPDIHAWVQEHGGETIIPFSSAFEQKLVDMPADEAAKYCAENQTTSLIPQIIKTSFAAIHLIYFFTAGPDEVKCWQIRRLTKAPQAAGAIHTDSERGFICAEVDSPLISTLICRRKLLHKMFPSCNFLSQLQRCRLFSTKKRKSMKHMEVLKAKNTGILSLDNGNHEVLLSYRKLIAQIRQYCHDYGKCVDLSALYGPGSEVYTAAGGGSFHVTVQHCKKSFDISISARDLHTRAWRGGEHGTYVLKSDSIQEYISEEDHKVLPFSGSYTSAGLGGDDIGDTWIGVLALRHAFHVLYKSDGSSADLLKQAIEIFTIHLSEAARIQSVFDAVCKSMIDDSITNLDGEPDALDGAAGPTKPPPSLWIRKYGFYSREAMTAVDKYISEKEEYTIKNCKGVRITSAKEIFREIRILAWDVYRHGVFADKDGDPPLAPPKESPPDATGKTVEFPYLLLNNWDTGMSRWKPEEYVLYSTTRDLFYFNNTNTNLMNNFSYVLRLKQLCLCNISNMILSHKGYDQMQMKHQELNYNELQKLVLLIPVGFSR